MNALYSVVITAALLLASMPARALDAITVTNDSGAAVTVYVSFAAVSVVNNWPICIPAGKLKCTFNLGAGKADPADKTQVLPINGKYLNATFVFGSADGCNITQAELNVNNPSWSDTNDISLVNGYNKKVKIDLTDMSGSHTLGPPVGKSGNEKVFGVFPDGCDGCADRIAPPCGAKPGTKNGCHGGTQYNPKPVCQYQSAGPTTALTVTLMP